MAKKTDDKVICMVSLSPPNGWDNDYHFYSDGRILHVHDQNSFKLNIENWITEKGISEETKKAILKKCSPEHKAKIKKILKLK